MAIENNKSIKTTERSDLAHKAYLGIRQMLLYNEISSGQKIGYQDLADKLGVSITPVIHALKWLEFINIVRYEHNKGYFVNEVSRQEIMEIYETRIILEVAILEKTIKNVDKGSLHQLKTILNSFEEAVKKEDFFGRLTSDMKFHYTLASLSQCKVQLRILEELFDLLFLRYSHSLGMASISSTSLDEHNQIYNCLKERDLTGLQYALSHHLENVKDHISANLDSEALSKKDPMLSIYNM